MGGSPDALTEFGGGGLRQDHSYARYGQTKYQELKRRRLHTEGSQIKGKGRKEKER